MCLGIPGQIVELDPHEDNLALVEVGEVRRQVNIACIVDEEHPPASCVGEWVLIHVGFALARIDPEEAKRTIELFNEMSDVQAELEAMQQSAKAEGTS